LHSLVLGIFKKNGTSNAVDTVAHVECQLALFDLHYKELVAVVTDTQATKISAGQLIVENSQRMAAWIICLSSLLALPSRTYLNLRAQ
jgi:hypothetical protein